MAKKENLRHEISEAFDFIRFLVEHPKETSRIKNGSEINIFCKEEPHPSTRKSSMGRKDIPQLNYLSEHTFHRL